MTVDRHTARVPSQGPACGLIEVVPNAKSLDSVKKSTPHYSSLADFFKRRYGGSTSVSYHRARRNFVQSLAACAPLKKGLQPSALALPTLSL